MITSLWEDIKESFFPIAHAEEEESKDQQEESTEESKEESGEDDSEESKDEKDDGDEESKDEEGSGDDDEASGDDEGEGDEGDEDEDDEDDEDDDDDDDDELVDPLVTLREKYTAGVCHDFKHHFDECTERVTAQMEQDDYEELAYKEDCVEEFFHLQHCLDDNVAKTLFSKLR